MNHYVCTHVILVFLWSLLLTKTSALVHLRGKPLTFLDSPARFAVPIDGSGVCGSLHLADPVDACYPLRDANATSIANEGMRFVLSVRGNCSFEKKVRIAQDGGFQAAVVYDDQDKGSLISMIGNSEGIYIHAIFVSKMAGETLRKYAKGEEEECCIGPSAEEAAGTVLVISLISLFIIISVLATFLFTRNCRRLQHISRNRPQTMNRHEVGVLPCFTFKNAKVNSSCMSETCAICLEDYRDGETIRILHCQHEFHSVCVDSWLTKWGTFCPVCKHDMTSGR